MANLSKKPRTVFQGHLYINHQTQKPKINKYKPFQKKHTSLKISPMFQKKEKEPEVIEEVAPACPFE